MPEHFYALNLLEEDRLPLALPLMRLLRPELELPEWRALALPLLDGDGGDPPKRGIVVAERNGYMRGLFAYHTAAEPDGAKCLIVSFIAMFEIADLDTLSRVLVNEIARLAERLDCAHSQVLVEASDTFSRNRLSDPGRHIEVLCHA